MMNLYLSRPPRRRRSRNGFLTPEMAFLLGMFIGYMLPMWIKIATN